MSDGIEFRADKAKVNGPRIDGGYTISFEIGEDEQLKVAAILTMKQDEGFTVEVTNG